MTRSSVSSSSTNAAAAGRKSCPGRKSQTASVRRAPPRRAATAADKALPSPSPVPSGATLRSLHAELRSLRASGRALKAQQVVTAAALKKLEHLVNVSIAHF